MKDKIEVGEYGRTNKGKIFIFAWLENLDGKRDTNKVLLGNGKTFENKFYYFDDGEKIVKHSKNLIDLIEVGDIVNGHLVDEVRITSFGNLIFINDYKTELHEKDIETILTKEEYLTRGYKVGGEDGI